MKDCNFFRKDTKEVMNLNIRRHIINKITLKNLNIDPCIYFLGTDAEIEEAERKERMQAEKIKDIIFSDNFQGLSCRNDLDQELILTYSIRQGVLFQLTYIDRDGVPAMHENYIKTSENHVDECIEPKENLLKKFVSMTLEKDIILSVDC